MRVASNECRFTYRYITFACKNKNFPNVRQFFALKAKQSKYTVTVHKTAAADINKNFGAKNSRENLMFQQ